MENLEIIENVGLVEVVDGKIMTTSRKISEVFKKEHKNVVAKIKEKLTLFNELNFKLVEYIDSKGESRPMYLLDRDFTSFLIMGFTGSKADKWKLDYIKAFNLMEEKLKSGVVLSEEDKYKLMLFSDNKEEVALASKELTRIEVERATKPLLETIDKQEPFVDLAKLRIDAQGCYSITDATRTFGLVRGRITNWAKYKGYIHKKNQEVNNSGMDFFKVYSKDGIHNQIGILEAGITLIKDNLEEIRDFKK